MDKKTIQTIQKYINQLSKRINTDTWFALFYISELVNQRMTEIYKSLSENKQMELDEFYDDWRLGQD